MESSFAIHEVEQVESFLQDYMKSNSVEVMVPDECAEILNVNNLLSNEIGSKPGFNFRQMLRDGRDGLIPLVKGAHQTAPNKRWYIDRV